jgi:hypothetical protein
VTRARPVPSEALSLRERLVFSHFFRILPVTGALAQWGLACWLLAPFGVAPPAVLHVVGPALLVALNRLASRRLEREPATGALAGQSGHVVLAVAFGAVAGAGVLAALTAGWAAVWMLGAFRAEAGVALIGTGEPFLGPAFRPAATGLLAFTFAAIAYGYMHGHRRLTVTRLTVPLAGLPPALANLRIVQVSDLHLGPLADRAALRAAFAQVAALDPDVVCVTGDVADSPATNLDIWMPELARLSARHGVFAILGNHDYYRGADRVADALGRSTRWHVLRDDVATVTIGGARLHLVGLEERPAGDGCERLGALLARVPAGEPVILLAHHPRIFPAAAAAGVPLMLAGHTHGGQLVVPGAPRVNPARFLITEFDSGSFERDGALLHVNRGLGTSGQRVRVGAPREITVVTLVPAAARASRAA